MVDKVSLYIPCFNSANTISKCIESISKQTYKIDEIIVIDDGSTDNTCEIASRYNVKIIQHKEHKGLAEARNTGISNSKNEYIASIDSDCVARKDWLETLIATIKNENIAGAGGYLIETNSNSIADKWRMIHLTQNWGNKKITNPRQLFGNNILFRKSALFDVGLYNPIYKTNSEDYDISQRLMKKGYTLVYTPKAKVGHIRKDTIHSAMNLYSEYYYFGYIRKRNIFNILRGILTNLFFSIKFFINDLITFNLNLLHLDLLSFFYAATKTIKGKNFVKK